MSPEVASAIISLLIALATALAVELRSWARSKQAKVDSQAQQDNIKAEAVKAAQKIKQDADVATAKLKADQEQFVLEQAKRTTELQTQLNATRDQLQAETQRSNGQDRTIGELKQANTTLDSEMLRLRDAKNAADTEISNLKQDLYHRSQDNKETSEENARLLEERKKFIEQIDNLTADVVKLKQDIELIKTEHHQQREAWQAAELPRQQLLARIRYTLRETGKLLNDEQKTALEHTLATKDISYAELVMSGGESEPPDVDERIQQLRSMNDFRATETKALITLLAERGVDQATVDHVLKVAHDRWRPTDETPTPPTNAIDPVSGGARKTA